MSVTAFLMYGGDVAIKSGDKAKPVVMALAIVSKSEINYSKHELKISNHDFINSRFAFGISLRKGNINVGNNSLEWGCGAVKVKKNNYDTMKMKKMQ